jgi:serine protease
MRRAALVLCLALALPASARAAAPGETGRLLVTLRPDAGRRATGRAVAAAAGARPSGFSVPQIRLVTVGPRPGESQRALARRLRADPRVQSVAPERRGALRFQPNDPALFTLEGAKDTLPGVFVEWWAAKSGFLTAWDISQGAGATVAVIDTGADVAHPELAGKVAELATFDAAHSPAGVDTVGHGTHVASLACAAGNNGVGLVGAGDGCRLLIVKSDFTDSSVAASIVWAVDHGADAINMSFGTAPGAQPSPPVVSAIAYAVAHGVVLVAAAADDPIEEQGYPASALQPTGTGPDIAAGNGLSVTAADFLDRRAAFAGHGTQISIAAYGAYLGDEDKGPPGIFGAFTSAPNALDTGALGDRRPCECRTTFNADPRYAYLQGTSMAAPMVAAAAALVRHLNPDMPAV